MRRIVLLSACVLAAALTVSAGASPARRPVVLKLISVPLSATRGPIVAKPGAPADRTPVLVLSEVDTLRNGVTQFGRPRLAVVGNDRALLTRYRSGRTTISGIAQVPGGTVRFRGTLVRDPHDRLQSYVPVVGGTDRYAGCRGTLTVRDVPSLPGDAANIYTLAC